MSTILRSFGIWSKLERWKSSISGYLMSWLKFKKIVVLKCHLLLFYATTMNHFSIELWHATKSGFYLITGNHQLRDWIEGKHWTCTKKRSWSLFGGLLLLCSTIASWIPVKSLHLRSMLSKSMRYTKNGNACSQHWSTQRAQFFSTVMPDHTSYNQHLKSWRNWATKFCLIHHIHLTSCQVITTSSSVWTTFCRENTSTISRMQKMFSKSSFIPKAQIFTL